LPRAPFKSPQFRLHIFFTKLQKSNTRKKDLPLLKNVIT
jgi:hypothetical protein